MRISISHRRSAILGSAIVVLAGAHCRVERSAANQDAGRSSDSDLAMSNSDAGGPGNSDLAMSRNDAASAGNSDLAMSNSDGAAGSCSPMCSADTPVCDHGQCKPIEVIAFYTPDAQMADRAHAAYTRHANDWFPKTAATQKFFTYEATTDWDRLKTIAPAPGRIIMFLDNSPGDTAQQAGFRSYMENGGAWLGCHVSAYNDDSSNWSWYFNEFLGCGHFNNNTWAPTSANLDVEDLTHPVSQGLGPMFASAPSEWYSWVVDLRTKSNIKILLAVDPSSFPLGTDPNQSWYSGYYPVAWTNTNYKMLYVNMGHEQMDYAKDTALSSTFDSPTQNQLYMNAFKWLGGAVQ